MYFQLQVVVQLQLVRIETGVANTGDAVDIIGMGAEEINFYITGIEMFRKSLTEEKLEITQVSFKRY